MAEYDVMKAAQEQKEYQEKTGITVKEAGERLVAGCPHCNRSYCD